MSVRAKSHRRKGSLAMSLLFLAWGFEDAGAEEFERYSRACRAAFFRHFDYRANSQAFLDAIGSLHKVASQI